MLISLLLLASFSVNADNYVEFGVTDLGSWEDGRFFGYGDTSKRKRKFIEFHKQLNNDFYLLGSYTKTNSKASDYSLDEKVSTLGLGYKHSLLNYTPYIELSAYKYTASSVPFRFGYVTLNSEYISPARDRNGKFYKMGLIKKLDVDTDIDISYGTYSNVAIDDGKNNKKSIKLIRKINDHLSLVATYGRDEYVNSIKRDRRSLSVRFGF